MRSRLKVKSLNIRTVRSKLISRPFQILTAEIMTGHIGEPMLHELYLVRRVKGRKWRD